MRSYSLLILLLGAVSSEPLFRPGKEYEYDYQGKLLSGIPVLDSQFAGLMIEGKIILQTLGTETYKLALKDVKYSKFNEKLTGSTEYRNWRHLITPEGQQIPSEFETILKTPIEFSMTNGVISEIKVSKTEPTWAINLKKSLISLIKIQTPTGEHDLTQNHIVRSNSITSLPPVWKVMEEGIDGKCETLYDIAELPEYMLQELAPGLIEIEKCEGKKIFQILKTRNNDRCVERSAYKVGQPGKPVCTQPGNCDSVWERSSVTRYIACGPTKENLELQVILNEGEIQQSLLAYNTENMVTGTKQIIKLVKVTTSKTTLPQIQSPITLEDLYYVYPKIGQQEVIKTEERKELLQHFPLTERTGLSVVQVDEEILTKLSPVTLKQKIIKKLTKVVEDLKQVEKFEEKDVTQYILSITKVLSLLDTKDIKSLYEEIKSLSIPEEQKEIMQQIVLEMVVISGTSPAIMFIKEMIMSEKISPLRIGTIIASLPHYVQTPTVKLLEEIFEIIKSPVVTRYETLKSNALLSFATLIHKACIAKTRIERFPVFVYGEFCSAHTSTLVTKYIPYMVSELQSARSEIERISVIMALGALGHESVIPILLPYIEGKSSPIEQRMAIYSLAPSANTQREVFLPIYSALVHNPSEERSVRIAALSILMKMQPSIVQFQELALSTWFEKDIEFHKFVYSTLKTLSEIEVNEQPSFNTVLYVNSKKARVVLPLVKPVPTIISSTMNYFTAEWLKELEIGYHFNGAYTLTSSMKHVYGRLEFFLEQLEVTPIELAMHVEGAGKLIEIVNRVFGVDIESTIHPEWRSIISKMNMKSTEEKPFVGGLWTKVFDDVQGIYGLTTEDVEPILRSIKSTIREPESIKSKVCGKTPINMVKLDDVVPTTYLVPSEMGLPILIEVRRPSILYTQGYISIECSGSVPQVEVSLTNKLASSHTGYVGTLCPFTKEVITAGVSKELTVNYPTKMIASIEAGKLKVVSKPTKELKSAQEVDLISYVVKPFTTIKPVDAIDVTPLIAHPNTRLIKSDSTLKTLKHKYGETVGIDMEYLIKTETNVTDMKSLIDEAALYNYSPINVVLFGLTQGALTLSGYPSLRYHEVKVLYFPTRSSTKEIEIEIGVAGVYKTKTSSYEYKPSQLQIVSPKEVLQKLSVETGVAVTGKINIELKGGSPKTYSLLLTTGHGYTGMTQKWTLLLENSDRMKVCVDGKLSMPSVPLRSVRKLESEEIDLSYRNVIGFGTTCEEHFVKVDATSRVSSEQKQLAMRSISSRKCEEVTRKVEEVKEKLEHVRKETPEYTHIERELMRVVEEKIEFCRAQLNELSTLDTVKLNIEYSPIPEYLKKYTKLVDVAVKTVLLPYMTEYETRESHNRIVVDLKFLPHLYAFNLVLTTEEGTVKYKHIRIPEPLREVIPVVATEQPIVSTISFIKESPLYPVCRIGDSVVKSFDNTTYSYELDDCYHILAADSSSQHLFSVLGKETEGKKEVKVFVHETEVVMKPSPRYTVEHKEYTIEVDGQPIEIRPNEHKEIPTKSRTTVIKIIRSPDDVLILETPYLRVIYDGKIIEVKNTKLVVERELKGLCGSNNGDQRDDVLTVTSCIAPTYYTAALSYRIQKSCSPLSREQENIKRQLSNCIRPKVEKTKVSQILKMKLGKCTEMKHSTIWQGEKFCISQVPIVECGMGCAPRSIVNKTVPFTCLPSTNKRVIKLYIEKVRRGDVLPELRNMDKTFTTHMHVPVSCTHPGL